MRHAIAIASVTLFILFAPRTAGAQDNPVPSSAMPEITQVRGDLYRVRDGQVYTIFVVTPEGIILGDPLGRESALWLRDELKKRYRQDVRFVLHTSHDYRRAAGSPVFNDTADIEAHVSFSAEVAKARHHDFAHYRFSARMGAGFTDTRTVTLGGRTVRMIHVPSPRTPESVVLLFPGERIAFAHDVPWIGRPPFTFRGLSPADVMAWLGTLAALDYDTLLLGDGRTIARETIDAYAGYLRAMHDAVIKGVGDGRTFAEILAGTTLDQFSGNPHFPARVSQLSELFSAVKYSALRLSAGATVNYVVRASAFCAAWTACSAGGAVHAGRVAAAVAVSRSVEILGEMYVSGQTVSSRTTPDVDEEGATRRTRGAVLLRWTPAPAKFSVAVVAGPSVTVEDVKGFDTVRGVLLPRGGSHPIEQRESRAGATLGFDLDFAISPNVSIRMPVRMTMMRPGKGTYTDSSSDVQVGIELAFRLAHRVAVK